MEALQLTPEPRQDHGETLRCVLDLLAADLGVAPRPSPWPWTANPDWAAIFDTAAWHGVIPGCARGIAASGIVLAPPEQAKLQALLRGVAQHNAVLAMEMGRVVCALEREQIPVTTFKGVATAIQVYGSLAGRSAGDIDLLVHPQDYERACTVLGQYGYALRDVYAPSLQASLWSATRNTAIDLHWGLPPARLQFDTEALWKNAQRLNLLGAAIPTLAAEHALLVFAVNIVKEPWPPPLHQLLDFAKMLNCRDELAWDTVSREARAVGCQRALAVALAVVEELWHIRSPLLAAALHPSVGELNRCRDEVLAQLTQASPYEGTPRPRNFRRWLDYHCLLQDNLGRRAGLTWSRWVAPTPDDRAWLPLPPSLDALYWLLRPLRVLYQSLAKGRPRRG
jgi:hypothetical protein